MTPVVLGMMMMGAEIQVTMCPMVRVVTGDLGPIMMVTRAQVCRADVERSSAIMSREEPGRAGL